MTAPHSDHRLEPLPTFNRCLLRSFAALEAAHTLRRSIHIAPLRPDAPVQPPPATIPAVEAIPIEPIDPSIGVDGRFGGTMPVRSRLSPSQRIAERRRVARVEPSLERRAGYVTYTIDPK